eukprot:CAMPEP_0179317106 /NCGR_PEP_ID=MMETSP0797-20121207/56076_1 /TAXON_ID=47934 /ORGANISM="Dinophysis acuminata, Strain DAEP01" /LENGTH=154 /DNA_ID=CAMNT_0021027991 /DNA_START=221 /DNA_END=684 /DNA_ORIENTATION=-
MISYAAPNDNACFPSEFASNAVLISVHRALVIPSSRYSSVVAASSFSDPAVLRLSHGDLSPVPGAGMALVDPPEAREACRHDTDDRSPQPAAGAKLWIVAHRILRVDSDKADLSASAVPIRELAFRDAPHCRDPIACADLEDDDLDGTGPAGNF